MFLAAHAEYTPHRGHGRPRGWRTHQRSVSQVAVGLRAAPHGANRDGGVSPGLRDEPFPWLFRAGQLKQDARRCGSERLVFASKPYPDMPGAKGPLIPEKEPASGTAWCWGVWA